MGKFLGGDAEEVEHCVCMWGLIVGWSIRRRINVSLCLDSGRAEEPAKGCQACCVSTKNFT